jgi:hypothetical protein
MYTAQPRSDGNNNAVRIENIKRFYVLEKKINTKANEFNLREFNFYFYRCIFTGQRTIIFTNCMNVSLCLMPFHLMPFKLY